MPVHVLTGRSGIGKSAFLIRPLIWLVFNKPAGDSFRRWGSAETRVDVWFDDDTGWITQIRVVNFQCHAESIATLLPGVPERWTRVSRIRSNKRNDYEMESSSDLVHNTYKIGSDRRVPDAVATYLNMSEINFQGQHDPIYLLGLNKHPFELARVMNELSGMGEVDEVLSRINGRYIKEQGEVRAWGKRVDDAEKELAKYEELPSLEDEVLVGEVLEEALRECQERSRGISILAMSVVKAQKELEQYEPLPKLGHLVINAYGGLERVQSLRTAADDIFRLKAIANVNSTTCRDLAWSTVASKELGDAHSKSVVATAGIDAIRNRVWSIRDLSHRVRTHSQVLRRTSTLTQMYRDVAVANKQREYSTTLRGRVDDINNYLNKVKRYGAALSTAKRNLAAAKEQFNAQMPDICPLCGSITSKGEEGEQ